MCPLCVKNPENNIDVEPNVIVSENAQFDCILVCVVIVANCCNVVDSPKAQHASTSTLEHAHCKPTHVTQVVAHVDGDEHSCITECTQFSDSSINSHVSNCA